MFRMIIGAMLVAFSLFEFLFVGQMLKTAKLLLSKPARNSDNDILWRMFLIVTHLIMAMASSVAGFVIVLYW